MRILFVVHQFYPEFASGTERVTLELARSAQRDGHTVEVLTCSLREPALWPGAPSSSLLHTVIDGVPVFALPAAGGTDALSQLGFREVPTQRESLGRFLARRPAFDLAHVAHSMRMIDVVEALMEHRIPYLLTLTDFFTACYRVNLVRLSGELCPGPAEGRNCIRHCSTAELGSGALLARQDRLKAVLFSAAAVAACSQSVAEVFRREHPKLRIWVIEHGIDLLRFGQPTKKTSDKIVFGYLGTLSEAKGAQLLTEAFAEAAPGNARLELVGPTHDEAFHALVKSRVGERITVKPAVPAHLVPETLAGFDLLCLPSLVPETFSLAMHEGFSAGLPCLVSDLGHPARVIREHECGRTLPANDTSAWRDAIDDVCADPTILERWRTKLPLPRRLEEEGFLYGQLYRAILARDSH